MRSRWASSRCSRRGSGPIGRAGFKTLAARAVLTQPVSEFGLADLSGGDPEQGERRLSLGGRQPISIQAQEQTDCEEGRPLVAVDECLILCERDAVRRAALRVVGVADGNELHWTRDS